MRLITLLFLLIFAAASAASAKNARVQCEDSSRCESAAGASTESSTEIARHPSGPQRRIESGERAPRAPARVSAASQKLPSDRERTAAGPITPDNASGEARIAAAPAPSAGTTESTGLGPWAHVLAIVMAAAGVLSLIVARIADA